MAKKGVLDGVPANLPKETPLVVNALVYRLYGAKVRVEKYHSELNAYTLILAEDHREPDGWLRKKGDRVTVERYCLFDKDDLPDSASDDLKEFVKNASITTEVSTSFTHRDIVLEGIGLLKAKLKMSSKPNDKWKLEYIHQEEKRILSNCEGA